MKPPPGEYVCPMFSEKARGSIKIPAGREVLLQLYDQESISLLDRLGPNDLQAIFFTNDKEKRALELDTKALAHLSRLRGLRQLMFVNCGELKEEAYKAIGKLDQIRELMFEMTPLKPEFLAQLSKMKRLETLDLRNCGGSIIPVLKQFPKLRRLYLNSYAGGMISDEDFAHIEELPNLEAFRFGNGTLTNEKAGHLKSLTMLRVLSLWSNQVGGIDDAGLSALQNMDKLESLSFARTPIQGPGLEYIGRLTNLDYLNLWMCKIEGESLRYITGLKKLRYIDLLGSPVEDSHLKYFLELPSLKYLNLCNTRVTREGFEGLKKQLPNCQIVVDARVSGEHVPTDTY